MAFLRHPIRSYHFFAAAAALSAFTLFPVQAQSDPEPKTDSNSITFRTPDNLTLEISALNSTAIRVRGTKNAMFSNAPELILTQANTRPFAERKDDAEAFILAMPGISVRVNKKDFSLEFRSRTGQIILRELPGARSFTKSPSQDAPADFYCVETSFDSPVEEALYGLGQFQDGALNLRNQPRQLLQVNTQSSVPFLYSSRGFGLLWHNYSRTRFNPADIDIPLKKTAEGQTQTVNITTAAGGRRETRRANTLTGEFTVEKDGEYAFELNCGQTMARKLVLSIDGKSVLDQRNLWLPPCVGVRVKLAAGKHTATIENEANDRTTLKFRPDLNKTVFRSDDAAEFDYTVIAGSADEVMHSYRSLSGSAPMLPLYAFGYWHCRERFTSQDDLLNNLREFRKRNIPVDIIVQDWQWWDSGKWNSMHFDPQRFADPKGMNDEIHKLNAHSMLSVWSKASKDNPFAQKMIQLDGYIKNTDWIDFTKPEAAKLYWDTIVSDILSTGIDSWWFDATEPENDDLHNRKINMGRGNQFRNIYPLIVNTTAYDRLRQAQPDRRALILTRCAFAGQHRQPSVIWTGDVGNSWSDFRTQIIAGLGVMMSGIPYWTTDTGGFFRPGDQFTNAEYKERLLRWFEFSTFSPILRVHGYMSQTELWRYGEETEAVFRKYLDLRYRLLPYIYSLAGDTVINDGTMMRPLVMDFPNDPAARQCDTAYMFGPAFLVSPVTSSTNAAEVYLPAGTQWFDFWTGLAYQGAKTVAVPAPIDRIPLFIRAGSIIPLGQAMQYTAEKKNDTLDICVYPGANGTFSLYEDNGVDYAYEKGQYSTIPFTWDNSSGILTIGDRERKFDGMMQERTFRIFLMNRSRAGMTTDAAPDITIKYSGKRLRIRLR